MEGRTPRLVPTLDTERLVLRAFRLKDAEALFAMYSDPEVMRYWSSAPHKSVSETEDVVRQEMACEGYSWVVTLRGDDRAVGKVSHFRWMERHARTEIGYILRRDQWRKGIVKEALAAILEFGWREMKLHSVEAQCDPRNEGSWRTLEGLGFKREGHLRENYFHAGEYCDTYVYSLLNLGSGAGR